MKNSEMILGATLSLAICSFIGMNYRKAYDAQIELLHQQLRDQDQIISDLRVSNSKYRSTNEALAQQKGWVNLGGFKVTYYWDGEDEWGDSIARPCDGHHKATPNHTIAVDPDVIPYGSKVMVDGTIYIAEDCGSSVSGNIVDIYVESEKHETHYSEVFILEY